MIHRRPSCPSLSGSWKWSPWGGSDRWPLEGGRPTDSNRSQLSWTKRSGLQAFGQTSRPGLTRETERKRELERERERGASTILMQWNWWPGQKFSGRLYILVNEARKTVEIGGGKPGEKRSPSSSLEACKVSDTRWEYRVPRYLWYFRNGKCGVNIYHEWSSLEPNRNVKVIESWMIKICIEAIELFE